MASALLVAPHHADTLVPNETERLDVELAAGEHHDPVVESLGHVVVRRRAVGSKARADGLSPSNGRAPPPPYAEMGTLADAYVTLYGTKVQWYAEPTSHSVYWLKLPPTMQ